MDARLDVELVDGKPPFVYGRVYIPHIVGAPLGWFLQPFDSDSAYGWKCILLPKAREEALRRLGITERRIPVKALKIVRYSRTGSSVLCEVAEYSDPPVDGEFVEPTADLPQLVDECLVALQDATECVDEVADNEIAEAIRLSPNQPDERDLQVG